MRDRAALACRSDLLVGELDGDLVLRIGSRTHTLKAGDPTTNRADMITAIRGGQHAELDLRATTFRQKDGMPNRRFLRHAPAALPALAASYIGMPVLLDHDTGTQAARIGTITASELHDHGGTGWSSFKMGLQIVKPEAVISVLDRTLDRFSIGWSATGPVNCSVHGVDVRSRDSCGCWPGETVMLDGKPHVVEFEFQSADGTEVSAVNVPAVKGTGIQDIRAALAAELSLSVVTPSKEIVMLTRLAAALGLATLTAADEDRAVATLDEMRRGRLAAEQERDAARTELATVKTELVTVKSTGLKTAIDAVLNGSGYATGRLVYGRDSEGKAIADNFEPMLRTLAETSGLDKLQSTLATMPIRVPVGQRPLDGAGQPPPTVFEGGLAAPVVLVQVHSERLKGPVSLTPELASMARQLSLDPADVVDTVNRMQGGV
jgi:hypothetical protein